MGGGRVVAGLDGAASHDQTEALDLALDGLEVVFPGVHDVVHGRRRGGEAVIATVGVEEGVVETEQFVLDFDVAAKERRYQAEGGSYDGRDGLTEVVVGDVEFLDEIAC